MVTTSYAAVSLRVDTDGLSVDCIVRVMTERDNPKLDRFLTNEAMARMTIEVEVPGDRDVSVRTHVACHMVEGPFDML